VIFLSGKKVAPSSFDKVLSNDFPSWLIKLTAPSPGNTPATAYAAAKDFEGDVRFRWDMWTWARMASRTGKPVYLYRFDHPTPCTPTEGCTEATRHGDEMPYVFGHDLKGSWSTEDRRLSQTMVDCWALFAKTGTCNGCGLPDWPNYSTQSAVMVIGDHPHLAPMQADSTLELLGQLYRWIGAIATHPIMAIVIALAIVIASVWLVIMLVRTLLRRRRLRRMQMA
jgi:para-nitrobenzyl esterase